MPLYISGNAITSSGINTLFFTKTVISNGLILHVDSANKNSYSGSGTLWCDLTENKNDGTLQSGVTYSSSNTGVMLFDNSSYANVTFTANQLFKFLTNDFTLEIWVYPTSFSSYLHMIAMSDQDTFALKANVSDGNIYFYSPSFTTWGGTPGWTLSINSWNHVVLSRRNGVAYCYLNGILKGQVSGFTNSFNPNTINVGAGWPNERPTKQVSQIRIYNRGIVTAEVLNNFYSTKGRFGF